MTTMIQRPSMQPKPSNLALGTAARDDGQKMIQNYPLPPPPPDRAKLLFNTDVAERAKAGAWASGQLRAMCPMRPLGAICASFS